MWPERGSNHSGEKPNGLSQLSYPLGYGGPPFKKLSILLLYTYL